VDFVDSEMVEPRNGNCLSQFVLLVGPIWPVGFTRLCGTNTDQHFYMTINEDKYEEGDVIEIIVNTVIREGGRRRGARHVLLRGHFARIQVC